MGSVTQGDVLLELDHVAVPNRKGCWGMQPSCVPSRQGRGLMKKKPDASCHGISHGTQPLCLGTYQAVTLLATLGTGHS